MNKYFSENETSEQIWTIFVTQQRIFNNDLQTKVNNYMS